MASALLVLPSDIFRLAANVLCQGESGSGASLDARDGKVPYGLVLSRRASVSLTGLSSAPLEWVASNRLCDEGSETLEKFR